MDEHYNIEQDQLVTFKIALLAKNKGFDVKCSNYILYDTKTNHSNLSSSKQNFNNWFDGKLGEVRYCSQPTQTKLQRWLREIHNVHIELIMDGWGDDNAVTTENLGYRAFIWKVGEPKPKPQDDIGMAQYEIILEAALESALQLI